MSSNGGPSKRGTRFHRIVYTLLAGGYYLSMAAMFLGLPVLAWVEIREGTSPPVAFWAVAMVVLLGLSLRARARGDAPGRLLAREEAPRLFERVDRARLAAGIGPVGEVRLIGLPNVGVTRVFRGGILYTRPVKVLLIGLPYLRTLTVPELESILLHEFGHFLGQDVHRGERLEVLDARLRDLRRSFDRTGIIRWVNPVYLWVRIYGGLFTLATASIRRRQELLADALAAETCGPTVFARGLLKSAAARRMFVRVAGRRVAAALSEGAVPRNVFREFREGVRALSPADRRRALKEAREAPERPLSHHPPLAERLERIGRLWVPRRRGREERASNLVPSLEDIEVEMTPDTVRLVAAAMVVRARRRGRDPVPRLREEEPVPAASGAALLPRGLPALLPA